MDEDSLYEDFKTLCENLGYTLVDCRAQQIKSGLNCQIIIYRPEGIGTEDCAAVYRTLMPRLEVLSDNKSIHLEVSSPGMDRRIRLGREYAIFNGRGVWVQLSNGSEFAGIIASYDGSAVEIKNKSEQRRIPVESVVKAKLDYTQEAG